LNFEFPNHPPRQLSSRARRPEEPTRDPFASAVGLAQDKPVGRAKRVARKGDHSVPAVTTPQIPPRTRRVLVRNDNGNFIPTEGASFLIRRSRWAGVPNSKFKTQNSTLTRGWAGGKFEIRNSKSEIPAGGWAAGWV
jgi:hypothetical protein